MRKLRRAACGCLLGAALAAPRSARADESCAVRLDGDSARPRWTSAVEDVEDVVATLPREATDCAAIVVAADEDGATVTFTTRDGRVGVRRIAEPGELRSLIEAMVIAVPSPPPPPPAAAGEAERPAPQTDVTPPAQDADRARLILFGGAGVKRGAADEASAPTAEVFLGAALARWELGVAGRWEAEHSIESPGGPRESKLGALGASGVIGRRQPIGSALIAGGVGLGAYRVEQEARIESRRRDGHVSDSFAEPRAELYIGGAVPVTARVRVRTQVRGELALLRHVPDTAELPAAPRWSLAFVVGIETGILP